MLIEFTDPKGGHYDLGPDNLDLHRRPRCVELGGIGSGLVVLVGLLAGKRLGGWTALFLATTFATCVTGFGVPFDHLLPSHKVGIVSLVRAANACG